MRQRYKKHSTIKALAAIVACAAAFAALIYWQWPFFEFWLILLLINF